ncbi:MAG TPA: hypothetical protein VL967_09420 [Terracidiphilus sp.]|nr:hypothetical protein [Terracidiphilus sp.]
MNEISQLLQQRFGMSADQAQQAENAILQLIESKLPPQFQGMVNSLLGTSQNADPNAQAQSGGGFGSLLGMAENLLSHKS